MDILIMAMLGASITMIKIRCSTNILVLKFKMYYMFMPFLHPLTKKFFIV